MPCPNFFIVGAPKCGTTAMSEYLREHPQVFMSTPKEPHFLAEDFAPYSCCSSFEEYLEIFSAAGKDHLAVGEASVMYLYSDTALERIRELNSEAKIIVMLRSHVDYVYAYHHQLLLNADEEIEDFEMAWRLQDARKAGERIPSTCRIPKLLFYEDVGRLGDQVGRLLDIFPREQVLFVKLENLRDDPRREYLRVLEFLAIENDGRVQFQRINQSQKYRIRLIAQLRNHPPERLMKIVKKVKALVGLEHLQLMRPLHKFNRIDAERPPLRPSFREELVSTFQSDVEVLDAHLLVDSSRPSC